MKIDRLQQLEAGSTCLTIIGLSEKSHSLAKTLGCRFNVLACDPQLEKGFSFFFSPSGDKSSEKVAYKKLFKSAGVYYISGGSAFVTNWEQIRENALLVGENLNQGDWVIFGEDIDPDMAEIVLLPILEKGSKLKMGDDFDIAFHPKSVINNTFSNIGYELKISHNLIIEKISRLLDIANDEFKSFQISFLDEDVQVKQIREAIKITWIPVLNEMDSKLFTNFVDACVNHRFLDKYPELKISTEWRVDYKRFFTIAVDLGLKHSSWYMVNKTGVQVA